MILYRASPNIQFSVFVPNGTTPGGASKILIRPTSFKVLALGKRYHPV